MKEEYLSKEFWDKAPEGTVGYTPDSDHWYEAWWKFDSTGNPVYKLIFPEHWQDRGWIDDGCDATRSSAPFYYKRPESFPEEENFTSDNSTSYVPSVGEECLASCWDNVSATGFQKVRFIAEDGDEMVFRWLHSGEIESNPKDCCAFKPLPKEPTMEEKLLDKWRMQSIDYAHDTEDSQYSLKSVFQFINKFYNVEEK